MRASGTYASHSLCQHLWLHLRVLFLGEIIDVCLRCTSYFALLALLVILKTICRTPNLIIRPYVLYALKARSHFIGPDSSCQARDKDS